MNNRSLGLFAIIIIILMAWYIQYSETKKYVEYVSTQLTFDILGMHAAIQGNREFYRELIHTRTITINQLHTIFRNNTKITSGIKTYHELALEFGRVRREKFTLSSIQIQAAFLRFFIF